MKTVLNIVDDSQCMDLKAGLRNLIDYTTDDNKIDLQSKCVKLIECHEECMSKHQQDTSLQVLKMVPILDEAKLRSISIDVSGIPRRD